MFVDPEKAVEALDLRPGMKAADFGCGAGFYTIPLARRLGEAGKVYAFDIRPEALGVARSKARESGFSNVETVRTDLEAEEATHLKEKSVDAVLISNILFQVENKAAVAREAFRILKPGGELMVVEWAEEKNSFGPPVKARLDRKAAEEFFLKAGFTFRKEFPAGEHHYGLIFKKP